MSATPRQVPVAITGVGLVCSRLDRAAVRQADARFLPLDGSGSGFRVPGSGMEFGSREPGAGSRHDRSVCLALDAAHHAIELLPLGSETGVCIAISKGLITSLEGAAELRFAERTRLNASAPGSRFPAPEPRQTNPGLPPEPGTRNPEPDPFDIHADAAARAIQRAHRLHGPAAAAVAACASGIASLKLGMDWLRDGHCDAVLAGASESSGTELVLGSFERLGVLSPTGRTCPFDAHRDGFVVSEGAAVFRIERQPSSPPLAYVRSIVLASDAAHLTAPDPTGATIAHTIRSAIDRAGLAPDSIGWIHAHGTATPINDAAEIAAFRTAFNGRVPPVTATKGMTGHLLGASGAVALAITLESLRAGTIPYVFGLVQPDPAFDGIDFVRFTPRASSARTALVLNYGFGGHIAAAVLSLDPE